MKKYTTISLHISSLYKLYLVGFMLLSAMPFYWGNALDGGHIDGSAGNGEAVMKDGPELLAVTLQNGRKLEVRGGPNRRINANTVEISEFDVIDSATGESLFFGGAASNFIVTAKQDQLVIVERFPFHVPSIKSKKIKMILR